MFVKDEATPKEEPKSYFKKIGIPVVFGLGLAYWWVSTAAAPGDGDEEGIHNDDAKRTNQEASENDQA